MTRHGLGRCCPAGFIGREYRHARRTGTVARRQRWPFRISVVSTGSWFVLHSPRADCSIRIFIRIYMSMKNASRTLGDSSRRGYFRKVEFIPDVFVLSLRREESIDCKWQGCRRNMQVRFLAPVPHSKLAPFHGSRQGSDGPTLPASGGAHSLANQILKKVTGVFGCSAESI